VQPLPNSRHVELHVVVRDDGVAAVEERGDVALHQRFIDATASRERVCSAQRMLKREAGMEGAREQRGRGWPVYAIQQQIAAFKTERTRRKHVYKPVQAIEHLLTTNLRICQNASNRTSLTAAADMKLRYAAMMYTHANTLARQELDRQQNQVVGQPVVKAALAKTSSSRQSSQNMPTLEHAMDLARQPLRGRTA